ncbi:MAG: hypothetical protein R6V46_06305 [Desulfatiglandaceae bacterium]
MKFTHIHARGKNPQERNAAEAGCVLNIELDRESHERLERLRDKLPKTGDSQLIALSLQSLEEKMGRIIKRKMIRKIRAMKSER